MKKKEKQIILESDTKDLSKQASELKKKLASLSVNRYTNQSKNVRERKNIRLQLAVMKTVLRKKELEHGNA
jgi:ribosomal protein L29